MSWFDSKANDADDRADQYRTDAANSRASAIGAVALGNSDRAGDHLESANRSDWLAQGAANEANGYRNA